MKSLLEKVLTLGIDAETPLELRVPYRVSNLLLVVMLALAVIWSVLLATILFVPTLVTALLLCALCYSLGLMLIALGFPNAGRFIGLGVSAAAFCFLVATVRPNFMGLENYLVALMAVPLVIFARSERHKILFSFAAIIPASAASFYVSQNWEGLFRLGATEATIVYYLTPVTLATIIGFAIWYFNFGYVESFIQLRQEKEKTATLLANTLPELIVERLNNGEQIIAESHAEAVVLFADIVGFSNLVNKLSPRHVVELLNELFTQFDHLAEARGVEKIKTIGDSYMAVGGLFAEKPSSAADVAELALDMREAAQELGRATDFPIDLRIGVAAGQVIGGVIGQTRMAFDVWGETVNLASRMESTGKVGSIQVSESTYWRLRDRYRFEERPDLALKEGTSVTSYFLVGRIENLQATA